MRGGARKGAGRKLTPDMIKICTKISRDNNEWLRAQKGKPISRQINDAISAWRERER